MHQFTKQEKLAFAKPMLKVKFGRMNCLEARIQSYNSAGTCTFYGTANSNQLVVEFGTANLLGFHLLIRHTTARRTNKRLLCRHSYH